MPNDNELTGQVIGDSFAPKQWCALHQGRCEQVLLITRGNHFFLACHECTRELKRLGAIEPGTWGHWPCLNLTLPIRATAGKRKNEMLSYIVELTQEEVILLRAQGFEVQKEE